MAGTDFNPKQFMSTLRILYLALASGVIIFLAVVINLLGSDNIVASGDVSLLFMIDLIMTALLLPGAYILSNRKFDQIKKDDTLENRLTQYQAAFILRMAMFEGAALFSVVILLVTGYMGTLALFTICLALIAINYPTPDKIGRTLDLSDSDRSLLE